MRILGVYGSLRPGSFTARLVDAVLEAAVQAGAEVRRCDLREITLPLFADETDYSSEAAVQQVKADILWAQGFVIGSPEYHGSMSGAIKNFFDHYYHEFSGKCFALVAAAGGGQAISCLTQMRAVIQYCHGWTLPYHVGVPEAEFPAEGGPPVSPRIRDRLARLGCDLARYSPLLAGQFSDDLPLEGIESGFAGLHRRALLGE